MLVSSFKTDTLSFTPSGLASAFNVTIFKQRNYARFAGMKFIEHKVARVFDVVENDVYLRVEILIEPAFFAVLAVNTVPKVGDAEDFIHQNTNV